MSESAGRVMQLFVETIQVVVNNNQQHHQQRILNIEMFESTIRCISRLFFALSEMDTFGDRLVDFEIFERASEWVQKVS
jgi:hypothetical protein